MGAPSDCSYQGFFKQICPDDDRATHTCPAGTDYQVTFCPLPINLAVSQEATSPSSGTPAEPTRKKSRTISKVLVILATTISSILVTMSLATMLSLLTSYVRKQRAVQCQVMDEEEEFGEL